MIVWLLTSWTASYSNVSIPEIWPPLASDPPTGTGTGTRVTQFRQTLVDDPLEPTPLSPASSTFEQTLADTTAKAALPPPLRSPPLSPSPPDPQLCDLAILPD